MNYYERHLGNYAKKTMHLSMLEHGAYNLLIDRYYVDEEGLKVDQVYRYSLARTKEERAAVDAILSEFFTLQDGRWIHTRCDEEITKARRRTEAARENGKTGGRPKKNPDITQEKPTGLSPGLENETQRKASQTSDLSYSVSDDTDAEPSFDLKTMVFNEGLRWLMKSTGRAETTLRSALGRAVKEHGEAKVIEAIFSAQKEEAVDPLAWMERCFQVNGTPQSNPKSIMAAAERLRAELGALQ